MSFLRHMFFSENCPNCSKPVDKKARYCRHCGYGNSNSWRRCLAPACGVNVAADSQNCWKCGSDLLKQPRTQIFSDRWMREPGQFAIRIPLESPSARLQNGIQVDHDTQGIMFLNGKPEGPVLGPGYHSTTTFLGRLLSSTRSIALEAVIASSEDTDVFVRSLPAYRTSDHREVVIQITLTVKLADLRRFTARYMPTGVQTIADDELALHLTGPVDAVLRPMVAARKGEELAALADPQSHFEALIKEAGGIDPEPLGLTCCGIRRLTLKGEVMDQRRPGALAPKPPVRPPPRTRLANACQKNSVEEGSKADAEAVRKHPPMAAEPSPKMEDFGRLYSPAVGLVVLTHGKVRQPLATAWLADGVSGLVTNAHVAAEIAAALGVSGEGQPWEGCSVIFEGGEEWRVDGWTTHPDYPALPDESHAVLPYDLAVLHAAPANPAGAKPRKGLPLASNQQAGKLQRFAFLAYLGFPLEVGIGVPVSPQRPVVVAHQGGVARITDWALSSGPPDQTLLITHTMPTAKGASGSPVFDQRGHVVGILCAGNMHSVIPPESLASLLADLPVPPSLVPSAAMLNYAIRIDALRDWLDL